MPRRRHLPWRGDSHQTASGKPGAVHGIIPSVMGCHCPRSDRGRTPARLDRLPSSERVLSEEPERGRSSGVEHNLAKVGVEGSNPFARSSRPEPNRSPFGRPAPNGVVPANARVMALRVRYRNETASRSPDGGESPDLEGWAIWPTRPNLLILQRPVGGLLRRIQKIHRSGDWSDATETILHLQGPRQRPAARANPAPKAARRSLGRRAKRRAGLGRAPAMEHPPREWTS
jgi:hypothetical protein